MGYEITIEKFHETFDELRPLYEEHYGQMAARLKAMGVDVSPFDPRLDEYRKAAEGGWLLTFVLRHDGNACGYGNCYLTNDMHNRDFISLEDTMFVTKSHRNGIGRKLMKFGLDELRRRGVKRFSVTAVTDTRAINLWKRLGFKETAMQMTYTF